MILRKRDKKHAEAIIKYCTDNGMDVVSTMGLWNHLVRLFKRMELLEGRAAKTSGAVAKQPATKQAQNASVFEAVRWARGEEEPHAPFQLHA